MLPYNAGAFLLYSINFVVKKYAEQQLFFCFDKIKHLYSSNMSIYFSDFKMYNLTAKEPMLLYTNLNLIRNKKIKEAYYEKIFGNYIVNYVALFNYCSDCLFGQKRY